QVLDDAVRSLSREGAGGVRRGLERERNEARATVARLEAQLAEARERAMRDVIADVIAFFRMPDEEYDVTHAEETRIAHLTADVIEKQYLRGTRIKRLLPWDSARH